MNPVFLTVDEVIEIHQEQIERYGGAQGIRDLAALESAVAAPQATFDGALLHSTIPEMAADLFHIIQNHPFVDGKSERVRTRPSPSC